MTLSVLQDLRYRGVTLLYRGVQRLCCVVVRVVRGVEERGRDACAQERGRGRGVAATHRLAQQTAELTRG